MLTNLTVEHENLQSCDEGFAGHFMERGRQKQEYDMPCLFTNLCHAARLVSSMTTKDNRRLLPLESFLHS